MNNIYICASSEKKSEYSSFIEELSLTFNIKEIKEIEDNEDATVVVLGGDGSLNYLINNIENINRPKVIYFPLGTANDFARSLSLNPIQPEVSIVKDIVNNSPTVTIPIMSCNSKNFINVATGGALALITESGSDILKNVTGKLSYYVGALDEILSPQEYEITFKTKTSNKRVILTNGFIISQGLYAGGGVKVSPHISPLFKETFNFLTLESKELASSLADILKIQQSDSITDLKESKIITEDLEELIIQSETELPLKLDGEEYTSKKLKFSKSGKELKFYLY